jgi:hypothetical protein
LSVVGTLAVVSRIAPQQALPDDQMRIWLATVNSKPAEWFGSEHIPMLLEYVRHVTTADMLTKQIEGFDPKWMDDAEGLVRMDRLTKMRAREATVIHVLARSMRLTHQSIYRADKAATLTDRPKGRKPWQRES